MTKRVTLLAIGGLLGVLGCGSKRHTDSATSTSGSPSSSQVTSTSEAPSSSQPTVAPSVDAEIVKTICKDGTCGGPGASVTLWRDAASKTKRFVLNGAIARCSHPPTTIFDETGKEVAAVANKPVAPDSPEAQKIREPLDRELANLTKGETIDCE
jgi:hypothetical protein